MASSTSKASCLLRWASSLANLRSSVAGNDNTPPDEGEPLGDRVLVGEARLSGEPLLADLGDVVGDSILEDLAGLVGDVDDLAADLGDLGVDWSFNACL